ncbi:hypothetical protein BJF87_22745 [Gordonia sp. CNJ-863]|nr:hypothetical protein BJF87_22745 [Gordonia sp. CNJ-863]
MEARHGLPTSARAMGESCGGSWGWLARWCALASGRASPQIRQECVDRDTFAVVAVGVSCPDQSAGRDTAVCEVLTAWL